jgi:hypothetical protein
MVNYAPRSFPAGIMLTVVRRGTANARDWQGDLVDPTEATHQIGPCDLKWILDRDDASEGNILELLGQITAPVGSDVLDSDLIRFPDGREFVVDGFVHSIPNPFTGWLPGVRFRIAKDGSNGLRRV